MQRRCKAPSQQSVELVEFRLRRVVVRVSGGALHLANDWVKCTLGMLWGAEVAQSLMRLTCKPFQKPRDKARFTDTRFARKQHHLTFATVRPRPASREDRKSTRLNSSH